MESNTPTTTPPKQAANTAHAAKKRRFRYKLGLSLIVMAVMFLLGLWAAPLLSTLFNHGSRSVTQRATVADDGNLKVTSEEMAVATVAREVSPSVVSIVTKVVDMTYFGPSEQEGAGTGIIVSPDGYVLTNKHVVSGAESVTVVLADGTSYENVKVLGTDPLNDIAFLKINGASELQAAELGDSSTISVGQRVVAIGNSLGQYQNTVTSGIISGTGRPVAAQNGGGSVETLTDLLQTDAAINPGNSGGPLLNLAGQVIGINTAIAANAEGMGFAIPINSTKGALKNVLAGKPVQRAYIGVRYVPITPSVAKYYNLTVKAGAYVFAESGNAVVPDGPADKAGIKEKDVITKVNGVVVGDKGSVASLVGEYAPGDTIELTLLRGRQTVAVKLTLESYR